MTTEGRQLYVDQGGLGNQRQRADGGSNNRNVSTPEPQTDFQRLARSSTGETLPLFGRTLFQQNPSTFAPGDQIPVTADYVIGPGDQILLRFWGPETFNSQLTVDTGGAIYVPKVGAIHVAGLHYNELEAHIHQEISRVYRNFDLSINMGHLRSVQVYVVGDARFPGAYTVSALSTVVNALFASGGPNAQGSMRNIQLRRQNRPVQDLDLYDLLLHGDKSKDVRLEQGDVIFIPPVGPIVALAGSVHRPAVYELHGETSVSDLIALGGGFTSVASTGNVSLERIDPDHMRRAMTVTLNSEGRSTILHDGDIVLANHISPGYEKSVTLRGNLAAPGRFAWHEGIRLSDIIPERKALLTNDYWQERNRLGLPVPLFQPLPQTLPQNPLSQNRASLSGRSNATQFNTGTGTGAGTQNLSQQQQQQQQNDLEEQQDAQARRATAAALAQQNQQLASSSITTENGNSSSLLDRNNQQNSLSKLNRIDVPAGEIDWSYAVIERLDPNTLKSVLLPFNLGKLVQDHDPSQNLELQPGDIVTILSQADIPVPLEEQTKYVRLEGEFASSGVYSVRPGETLQQLVQRAGGLTPKAYLYGSSFLRVSARNFQQQRLDEYITKLSAELQRSLAVRSASTTTGVTDPMSLTAEQNIVNQLRSMRATGRVVLNFEPDSMSANTIPDIPLENGDVFHVPPKPNDVSVIGAVYGQNVFLYNPKQHLSDYVALAGHPNRIADNKHAFIIRANGSILSREHAKGFFSNQFDNATINPGDAIVVPEKMIKPDTLHTLMEYSQIFSSFGILAAILNQ
jgi:protein involved in polysaccharide export with SLBB domain